jgi:oxygen-independent coproporphyrinogen-3 oxidase
MFTERFRSHHDAERQLVRFLGLSGKGVKADQRRELDLKLHEKPQGRRRGIYIHVPYCDRICSFCNMNRTAAQGADLEAYTGYVIDSIQSFGAYPYIREQDYEAVYFGGGTPTVLSTPQLTRILKTLGDHIPLRKDCEITVESTLHNLEAEKVSSLADLGVNRFSIGIQTFSDSGRQLLGRNGSGTESAEKLQALRKSFTGVLGVDIIYSYPNQTLEEAAEDALNCINSGADSVSFYSLMIQRASALAERIEQGALRFDRDISFDLERHTLFYQTLKNAGFALLELSKLVRPGADAYRYIHIMYDRGDMIPIGAGAGGYIGGFPVYSMGPGRLGVSAPDDRYDAYYRALGFLQFGVYDPHRIGCELGDQAREAAVKKIDDFMRRGFLEYSGELTPEGVFWGNNMAVEMLQAVIAAEPAE